MLIRNRALILATNLHAVAAVTWSPSDTDANITLSNGNLTATSAAAGDRGVRATLGHTTGKWYFEAVTGSQFSGGDSCVGMLKAAASFANLGNSGALGAALFTSNNMWNGTNQGSSGLGAFGTSTVIGIAVDLDNNRVWFTKNGSAWSYGGDPASGTGSKAGGWTIGDSVFPAMCLGNSGDNESGRFKLINFTLTPPSGFSPWS